MNLKNFTIFPAIHLRNGEVVRFTQGDIKNPVVFHNDPLACAQQWIDQGAEWLQSRIRGSLIKLNAADCRLKYSGLRRKSHVIASYRG